MSGARRLARAGKAAARLAIGLAAAAAALGTARAQDELPKVVSPLRVQGDVNGVNLVTGRIAIDPPVLSVPAAPNLRFDCVQNATPYMTGRVVFENIVNYAIHTGTGASEAFRCEHGVCTSPTGTGSTLVGENTQTGIAWTFTQAGTGIVWNFTLVGNDTTYRDDGRSTHYAASVVHPNGERLDHTHDFAVIGGNRWFRTTRITSNLGSTSPSPTRATP